MARALSGTENWRSGRFFYATEYDDLLDTLGDIVPSVQLASRDQIVEELERGGGGSWSVDVARWGVAGSINILVSPQPDAQDLVLHCILDPVFHDLIQRSLAHATAVLQHLCDCAEAADAGAFILVGSFSKRPLFSNAALLEPELLLADYGKLAYPRAVAWRDRELPSELMIRLWGDVLAETPDGWVIVKRG